MAINNWASLEDVNQETQPEGGVFNSIKETITNVADKYNTFADKVDEAEKSALWFIWWAAKWIKESAPEMLTSTLWAAKTGIVKLFSWDIDFSWKLLDKQVDKQEFNDFELKQAEKLNNLDWWDMTKDITSTLWDFWKSALKQDDLSKSIKVDKLVFDTNVWAIQSSISELDNKLSSIDKNKYSNFLSFNEQVYQNYLKDKKVSNISDQADFELYKQQELKRLNWIQQNKILEEESNYMIETSDVAKQKAQKEEELRWYLNENIIAWEWKTWEQVYNEINKKTQENMQQRDYINTIWEIYNYSKQQVEDRMESMWLAYNSDFAWYDAFKDAIVDDIAAENQYMLSIKWMKDLPNYEELADQAKLINKASLDFKMQFAKTYLDVRNNPENKSLTEPDIRQKALKQSWDTLDLQTKQTYKDKEQFITQVAAARNAKDMVNKASNLDPRALIDIVSFGTSKVQSVIDQAYDGDTDDVPHYVKQDTRNMVYAWEWIWKNIATAITYNPDVLLSILIPTVWGKKLEAWVDALKAAAQSNKILKAWMSIWYWNATTRFIWKSVKNVASSQLYWAIADTVFDNITQEAPTKSVETFNLISNVLFDTTPFVLKEAKWWMTTSANRIAYEFLHWDEKTAVKQFAQSFGEKTGTKIWIWEAKTILDEWVRKLYNTTFDPTDYVNLMKKPWELYSFVSKQIDWLSKDNANKVLTEKWLAFEYKDIRNELWFDRTSQLDLTDAFNKKMSLEESLERQMNEVKFNNLIKMKEEWLNPWVWAEWSVMILKKKVEANKAEYTSMLTKAKENINLLKASKTSDEFTENLILANESIKNLQSKFSNKKKEMYIKLHNQQTWIIEMRIWEVSELSDKNIIDLFKEWKVKFSRWEYKDKDFTVIASSKSNIQTKLNEFNFNMKSQLDELEESLWLVKDWVRAEWYVRWNDIQWAFNKLILWKTGTVLMPFIKNVGAFEQVALFLNSQLRLFLWEVNMDKFPVYINDVIKTKNPVTNEVSWQEIRDYMLNHDSFINLSYWNFIWKDNKEVFVTYLMPWKKLFDIWTEEEWWINIFKDYFNWLTNSWSVNWAVLIEQANKIISSIFDFSVLKNWQIDFNAWVARASAEFAANKWMGLFNKWILSEKIVTKEVLSLLSTLYPNNKLNKES